MIEDIHRGLMAWADWRLGRYGYRYRTVLGDIQSSRGASGGGSGAGAAVIRTRGAPRPSMELLDMQRAIEELKPGLQRGVLLFYCGCCDFAGLEAQARDACVRGGHRAVSTELIAELLGCARPTVYDRMHSAHTEIAIALRTYHGRRPARLPVPRGTTARNGAGAQNNA